MIAPVIGENTHHRGGRCPANTNPQPTFSTRAVTILITLQHVTLTMTQHDPHPEPAASKAAATLQIWADHRDHTAAQMQQRADEFYADMRRRRSVRDFSNRPVAREVIEACLLTAGTAPSGANQQPWHFCVITDSARKRQIRQAAEAEEREFYSGRAPEE
jgi:Nitroreductase family